MAEKHTQNKKLSQEEEDFFECLSADPTSLPGQQPFHEGSDIEDEIGTDTSRFFVNETTESQFGADNPVHADPAGGSENRRSIHWTAVIGGVLFVILAAYWFIGGSSSDDLKLMDTAAQSEQIQGTIR